MESLSKLTESARDVLERNWTGRHTVPAAGLYPHQWSWDSAFIAIGYAGYAPDRACREMLSLFEGQWDSGLLPNVVFDPDVPDYFPGPDYWQTDDAAGADVHVQTSGIVQPPMHAIAVREICRRAADSSSIRDFAAEMIPKLQRWHDYLYRERDPHDESLVYIRHPWESGRDNSPVWDPILQRLDFVREDLPNYERHDLKHSDAAQRPSDREYDCFIYLAEIFKRCRYDEAAIRQACPFLVQDVMFNAILCEAERALADVIEWIGGNGRSHRLRADRTAAKMRDKLWDEGDSIFKFYDLVAKQPFDRHVAAGFTPIYAGIPTDKQAHDIHRYINSADFCSIDTGCFGVPSYDRREPDYNPGNYWRGPVWINMNWMLIRGLARYGYNEYADWLTQRMIDMVESSGFYEYYDVETGRGEGAADFSWTAALTLALLHDRETGADA